MKELKTKKQIRKHVLAARKALSAEETAEVGRVVFERVLQSGLLEKYRYFHLYYPINNEVDTVRLIEYLWEQGKTVVMPRTDFENKRVVNYAVESFDQLEKTVFNMREPLRTLREFDKDCDVIFVPGVSFDEKGNRLGYGGGFYDRFLAESKGLKVALAYELQVLEQLPVQAHDIGMDMVITEKRVIS